MATRKKQIRNAFRRSVFARDRFKCCRCGKAGRDRQGGDEHLAVHQDNEGRDLVTLDAHHIRDRTLMPNGGYVKENGITVCDECHLKAEQWWVNNYENGPDGFSPSDLYEAIGSSQDAAEAASERLA